MGVVGFLLSTAVLSALAWVGAHAWVARGELLQAQAGIADLRSQVAALDLAGLQPAYDDVRAHTAAARAHTDDPVWRLLEHVPLLGPNLTLTRELSAGTDDVLQAVEPAVEVAQGLDLASLGPQGGRLPVEVVERVAAVLPGVASDLGDVRERLHATSESGSIAQLREARTVVVDAVDTATSALDAAAPVVAALPPVLGADAPRVYVVMFLNNAELRPLGGTALSFAEIHVDRGAISLGRVVPAVSPGFRQHDAPVIPAPDGFDQIVPEGFGRYIANATLRPSDVTAAQIVQAEWRNVFGEEIDGVVAVDAGALAGIVGAIGPIPLSTGDVVAGDNLVSLLLNTVYTRYDSGNILADDAAQGAVYAETVAQTFGRLTGGGYDPVVLLQAARTAADQRRLSVWLADPALQAALEPLGMGARDLVVESTGTEDVLGVYLNDRSGSKVSYYLGTDITKGSAVCTPDGRQVHRITLTLANRLPADAVPGLSRSVSGMRYAEFGLKKGELKLGTMFYIPPGATFLSASLNGNPVPITERHDTDRPVLPVDARLSPGDSATLTVDVLMGTPGARTLVTDVTPTADSTLLHDAPLSCSEVALP